MPPIEIVFRIAGGGLLLLLAIILAKDHRDRPSGILGAIFAFCCASDGMWPLIVEWDWEYLDVPHHLLSMGALVVFWLLSKSLFEETFRWRWWYLAVYVVFFFVSFGGHYITFGDFRGLSHWVLRTEVAHHGLALVPMMLLITALVAAALYAAFKDWRVDLVESRRRARMMFVLILAAIILIVSFVEFLSLGLPRSRVADIVASGSVFFVILGFCTSFLGVRWGSFAEPSPLEFRSDTPEALGEGESGTGVIDELTRAMDEERLYCEEGLTIGRLAEKLEVKEYRLRRLINGHLGYRNFNQFLNRYRIEEAARQIIAPETRHLPILSIALDIGYRSLTPFNKAFKETHGVTPTEYRSRHRASVSPIATESPRQNP